MIISLHKRDLIKYQQFEFQEYSSIEITKQVKRFHQIYADPFEIFFASLLQLSEVI